MEFKVNQSSTFIMNMFLVVLALLMAFYSRLHTDPSDGIISYAYILWLLIAILRFSTYRKYLYLMIYGKPVLIVNEEYIYDAAQDIKYKWEDITEIKEANAFLYIELDNEKEYLARIKNPLTRLIIVLRGTALRINIDMVKVNPNALLQILDDYSIKANDL